MYCGACRSEARTSSIQWYMFNGCQCVVLLSPLGARFQRWSAGLVKGGHTENCILPGLHASRSAFHLSIKLQVHWRFVHFASFLIAHHPQQGHSHWREAVVGRIACDDDDALAVMACKCPVHATNCFTNTNQYWRSIFCGATGSGIPICSASTTVEQRVPLLNNSLC